jgi:hypothetical protein
MPSQTEQQPNKQREVLPTQKARQAKELGTMRYVLAISLGLAVIAGLIIYYVLLG